MSKEITICLYRAQWECLEPHLTGISCTEFTESGFPPSYDCCIICDEADYQKVLQAAKEYCPTSVNQIEKQHTDSLMW